MIKFEDVRIDISEIILNRMMSSNPFEDKTGIVVKADITAPLYWWQDVEAFEGFCASAHDVPDRDFVLDDFSHEDLIQEYVCKNDKNNTILPYLGNETYTPACSPRDLLELSIKYLNGNRLAYLKTGDKHYLLRMIKLLPSSYNHKRSVVTNYEALSKMYKFAKDHKLAEWAKGFTEFVESLPSSQMITGIDIISDLATGRITPNHARKILGLPPIPDLGELSSVVTFADVMNMYPHPNEKKEDKK